MLSARLSRVVLITAAVIACAGLVLTALMHIQRGEGAQVYRTYWGMLVHWSSVVVFFAALAMAAAVAYVLRWWDHRQQLRLERDVAGKLSATKGSRRGG